MKNMQPRVVKLESGDRITRGDRRYALGLLLAVFTLMVVFALGPHLELFLGFLVGGWLNQWYGWRVAFLAAGMPGLLLAGVVHLTLKDPPRGLADQVTPPVGERPRLVAVWRDMWSRPSLRHILAGGALANFVAYGFISWLPAHLARSHGAVFLAPSTTAMLWLLVLPGMLLGVYVGPTFALVQALADPGSRAVAAAILLFIANLIGLGLGPLVIGVLSDLLRSQLGGDSLRMALLLATPVSLWAAFHYAHAGRTLGRDLARGREPQVLETTPPTAPVTFFSRGGIG